MQVDTGPLIYPDFQSDEESEIRKLQFAYVCYNTDDVAEFVLRGPTPVTGERPRGGRLHRLLRHPAGAHPKHLLRGDDLKGKDMSSKMNILIKVLLAFLLLLGNVLRRPLRHRGAGRHEGTSRSGGRGGGKLSGGARVLQLRDKTFRHYRDRGDVLPVLLSG